MNASVNPSMNPSTNPGAAIADVAERHPRVAVLAAANLATVAAVGAFGNQRAWPYLLVLVGVTVAAAVAGAGGRLGGRTLAALAGLGSVHAVCGLVPAPDRPGESFYEHWLVTGVVKVDQVVHAGGTAILTVAAAQLLGRWLRAETGRRLRWTLALGLALGLGALNEVFEFLMAQRIDGLRIGDGANTGWDLVYNLAGGALVWVVACTAQPSVDSDVAVGSPDGARPLPAATSSGGRPAG